MKNDNTLIPDAAVRAIQDSVKADILHVDGKDYLTREVFTPPPENLPRALQLHTLTGVVDYVKAESEGFENGLLVHVVSHDTVQVVSFLYGRAEQRAVYATASSENVLGKAFCFGSFVDSESFIISLQSLFEWDEQLKGVLRVVGNIKEESVRQAGDDGMTQTVTARAGIVKVEEVEVPNPVVLRPFRTFREVEQPSSVFILRMRQGREGSLPSCALFEADGGQWKLEAIKRIKTFLAAELDGYSIVA